VKNAAAEQAGAVFASLWPRFACPGCTWEL